MTKILIMAGLVAALVLTACDRSEPPAKTKPDLTATKTQVALAPAPQAAPQPQAASSDAPKPAASAEDHYSPTYETCLSTGGAAMGVTYDMAECTHKEIEYQDRLLNSAYQTAMRSLEPDRATKLRQAQRAWIRYRDSQCAAVASSGGTMDILNRGGCILSETVTRRLELEGMAPFD